MQNYTSDNKTQTTNVSNSLYPIAVGLSVAYSHNPYLCRLLVFRWCSVHQSDSDNAERGQCTCLQALSCKTHADLCCLGTRRSCLQLVLLNTGSCCVRAHKPEQRTVACAA